MEKSKKRDDANYYFGRLVALKQGERDGNLKAVVSHCGEYMLLEAKQGNKRTDCWSAARFLAGMLKFSEVSEI